jgi:hypothetical protein
VSTIAPAPPRRLDGLSPIATVVLLADLDALIREARNPVSSARLRKLGFDLDGVPRLVAARERLSEGMDRRWTVAYERAHQRYGRAVVAVRGRVCSGCFVTLPTIARPRAAEEALHVCESCGRILYWT